MKKYLLLCSLSLSISACLGAEEDTPELDVIEQAESSDPVHPKAAASWDSANSMWLSNWDNPVMVGSIKLRSGQAMDRIDGAWEFDRLNLRVQEKHGGLFPGSTNLIPWPRKAAAVGGVGKMAGWEVHGTTLPPQTFNAVTGVQRTISLTRDDWDGPELAAGEAKITLKDSVSLVPVNVIVLTPVDDGHVNGKAWVTNADMNALFDDIWEGSATTFTNPDESPHEVLGEFTTKTEDCFSQEVCKRALPGHGMLGRTIMPDRIFDQCAVQFRKVGYKLCPVKADVFWNNGPDTCNGSFGLRKRFNELTAAATACAEHLMENGAVNIIFAGSLDNLNDGIDCTGGTALEVADPVTNTLVATANVSGETLSHELGHVLGLDDLELGECGSNLMCGLAGGDPSIDLTPTQCSQVRTEAKAIQDRFFH